MVEGKILLKASTLVDRESPIRLIEAPRYVSRGGVKLEKALEEFGIDVSGKTVLDVGASTGGFSDCLLKKGAREVIAVDVGYGQIALSLRNDPRVRLMERTNIRHLTSQKLELQPDMATVDLSFISLKLVSDRLAALLKPGGEAILLIKPQFEVGREAAKKGIVREAHAHERVLTELAEHFRHGGWRPQAVTFSPIKGPKGNIEFLMRLILMPPRSGSADYHGLDSEEIETVVGQAHKTLAVGGAE